MEIYTNESQISDNICMCPFSSENYLKSKSDRYGWVGDEHFVIPFFIKTTARIFNVLTVTSGPQVASKYNVSRDDLDDCVLLVKERFGDVDLIGQPQANALFSICPSGSRFAPFGSYIVDLSSSADSLFSKIHSKHRNVIKKAQKNDVVVRKTSDVGRVFSLIRDTMKRQNRAFPSYEYFMGLSKSLGESIRFYEVVQGEQVQGVAVIVYNEEKAYYLHGGSISRTFSGSLNLLHWQVMLDLKSLGVRSYDFMGARLNVVKGSKLEGIQRFKARFGGDLKEAYIWKFNINPLKAFAYNLTLKLKRLVYEHKFEGDAIDQEIARAKSCS